MTAAHPVAWLVYRDADGPQCVPLKHPGVVVGRDPGLCDVAVKDFGLSRQHARIAVDVDGRMTLTDLESKGGSQVNGQPVVEASLAPNDRVRLGQVPFLIASAPPAATAGEADG